MAKSVFTTQNIPETTAPCSDPGEQISWRERREWLRCQLEKEPALDISPDEIEVHFSAMPTHYWEAVTASDLRWGLSTIHGFLKLLMNSNVPPTMPFLDWRAIPESGRTRLMLSTWDRHGLLAKVAAACSAVHVNILEADVYTRTDNVVLDVFSLAGPQARGAGSETRLKEMSFLLEGALSEPPRFASVWAYSRYKFLSPRSLLPPRITLDNESSATETILRVEAGDRLGLLYDILQAIAESGLNITQARIETEKDLAHDVLRVQDEHGRKIIDPPRLEELQRSIARALANDD